jgi:sugar (pentulose or hexulose) kinase
MGDGQKADGARIAVFDVGKTNIKLSAMTLDGVLVESLSVHNKVRPGPPWRQHDLKAIGDWLFGSLATLCRHHPLEKVVGTGHGSAGVLVNADPDETCALPMIDYEQDLPAAIREGYAPLSGDFFDRGSSIMLKAAHQARQLYWMQQVDPERVAQARWYLGLPQYWAWRLSGVPSAETTILSAQSHLWNNVRKQWSPIVAGQGWQRLMPPFHPAWETLGPIRQDLARRHGIPEELSILTGGHDSSLNLYRYQAAGMRDASVISTGTWIVGMCAATPLDQLDENRGMVLNSDVAGRPVGGVLTMGGREFSHVAGQGQEGNAADAALVSLLIERGTFALPSFGDDDGLFPGSAGLGRFEGPPAEPPAERKALAVLYAALLTVECIDALNETGLVALDGTFLRDPLYATLVAALRPNAETVYNLDSYGTASGAALLGEHDTRDTPAPIGLSLPTAFAGDREALAAYAQRWRELAKRNNLQQGKTSKRNNR